MNLILFLCLSLSTYLIEDPGAKENRVDYLILIPEEFRTEIRPLAEHRAGKGLKVGIVTLESIQEKWKSPLEFIRFAGETWTAPPPRFLLLVGDADRIPALVRPSHYQTKKFSNDAELGTDHLYGVRSSGLKAEMAVGRFPADSKEEVSIMVSKTLRYEKELKPGVWQKKINFITGEAGFSPFIDKFIEAQFSKIVSESIPPPYDIELAYSKTSSLYCPYPPDFNENAIRLLNEGSLFYVYVGHGFRKGFDTISWNEKDYPIFNLTHIPKVNIQSGSPIMFVIACSTAFFDAKSGDCVGEELFKQAHGPVAFLGGTRITQPYANALIGKAIISELFEKNPSTLGEAFFSAKNSLLEKNKSPLRKTADQLAGLVQGTRNLAPMRKDGILHYTLLGDPALEIRKPKETVTLSCPPETKPGDKLNVTGTAPFSEGTITIQLDCLRDDFVETLPEIDEEAPNFQETISERYRAANTKKITSITMEFQNGKFAIALPIPSSLEARSYYLKATVTSPEGTGVAWAPVECVKGN